MKRKKTKTGAHPRRSPPPRPPRGAARRHGTHAAYPFHTRLAAVKMYLEEGRPRQLIAEELGVCPDTVWKWSERYRQEGRAGLEAPSRAGGRKGRVQRPAPVHRAIVEVKQAHPGFGVKRIAQWLRRTLLLPASPETVRQTLHRHQLLPKTKPKRPARNPPKPRFFERATPMQLWQSDISTIRLGGANAYLIGFMDDYSRYLVGLGVYRSQTTENVLEVYRMAVAEYGVPKEMLTDNGRQYASWRGKTRFQMELQKDQVHHIRSQPHHPMTLGKIERFWKTIWDEFLVRAQFDTFEAARERIALWVKYYNHKRPHQALEGLCPADRFFAIQAPLREALERGMQENLLELALRGEPKKPFYMVGQMGGQSVVMKVEKGELKMVVDGEESRPVKEVNYPITGGAEHEQQHGGKGEEGTDGAECAGERPGGAGGVDGAAAAVGGVPGAGGSGEPAQRMAGPGDGGYAGGLGAPYAPAGGSGAVVGSEDGKTAGAADGATGEPDHAAGGAGTDGAREAAGGELSAAAEGSHEAAKARGCADAGDAGGVGGAPDGDGSGGATAPVAQDVLCVGAAGAGGDAPGVGARGPGPARADAGSGEGGAGGGEPPAAGGAGDPTATGGDPDPAGGEYDQRPKKIGP